MKPWLPAFETNLLPWERVHRWGGESVIHKTRGYSHYVTQTCNIRRINFFDQLLKMGLGPLEDKIPTKHIPSPNILILPKKPPPDFVLRGPNPLLKGIKLSYASDITWLSHVTLLVGSRYRRQGRKILFSTAPEAHAIFYSIFGLCCKRAGKSGRLLR